MGSRVLWGVVLRKSKPWDSFQSLMTARTERAVRAVPGATSGPRDGVSRQPEPSHIRKSREIGRSLEDASLSDRGLGTSLDRGDLSRRVSNYNSFRPPIGTLLGPSEPPPLQDSQSLMRFQDVSPILHQLEGHRGAFRLLTLIRFCGPNSMYEMRRQSLFGQRALKGTLAVLLELKLVEPESPRPFPYSRTKRFRLTERGRTLMRTPMENWSELVRLWSYV